METLNSLENCYKDFWILSVLGLYLITFCDVSMYEHLKMKELHFYEYNHELL
jgi:hypothetical protein